MGRSAGSYARAVLIAVLCVLTMSLPTAAPADAQAVAFVADADIRSSVAAARAGTSFIWDWPTSDGTTFTITATDQTATGDVITTHAAALQTSRTYYVVSSVSTEPGVTQSCIAVAADDATSASRCIDVLPSGDANCDNVATNADALTVAQVLVGLIDEDSSCPLSNQTQFNADNADVNDDGSITIADAVLAAQCAAGTYNAWCNEPAFDVPAITLPPEFLEPAPPTPAGPVTVSVSNNQATVDFSGLAPADRYAAVIRIGNKIVAEEIVTASSLSAPLPVAADYPELDIEGATICATAVALTGPTAGTKFGGSDCVDKSPLNWSQRGALQPVPLDDDGQLRRGPEGEYLDAFTAVDTARCATIPWNATILGPGDTTIGIGIDVSQPGNVYPPVQFIWVPRWFNPYAISGIAAVPSIDQRAGVAVGVKPSFLEFFPPNTGGLLTLGPEPRTSSAHFYPRIEAPDGQDWGGSYWPVEIHTNTASNDGEYGWGFKVVWDLNQQRVTRPYVREPCRVLTDPEMYYDERNQTAWEMFAEEVARAFQEYCDSQGQGDGLASCLIEGVAELIAEFIPGRECVRWLLNEGGDGRNSTTAAMCAADGLGPIVKFLRPLEQVPIVVRSAGEIVEVVTVSGEEIYKAWQEAQLAPGAAVLDN